ncbi:hypothetical protein O9929_20165 [Vibrio lentus]|nr:hypothetical protein [Vibrio lentus]
MQATLTLRANSAPVTARQRYARTILRRRRGIGTTGQAFNARPEQQNRILSLTSWLATVQENASQVGWPFIGPFSLGTTTGLAFKCR